MNIILFQPSEVEHPLLRSDERAHHLLRILRLDTGGSFDAGVIGGARGKGMITAINQDVLLLSFTWDSPVNMAYPIHLLIGLPRPQTARDILRDATSLGVASITFVATDKTERSYAQSSLWKTDEWKNCVIRGMAQAFSTNEPLITHAPNLEFACALVPEISSRLALDNYEAPLPLSQLTAATDRSVVVAVGAERGWSGRERQLMREFGFQFGHLGTRVLRTETAVTAALTLVAAKLGLI